MMEFTFLGGAREVGRSAILLEANKERILLDYGVNVQTMEHPAKVEKPLDAVFVSHAHLDHSGFLPYLYRKGFKVGVWATPITFDIAALLLRDCVKVQFKKGIKPNFLEHDIEEMEKYRRILGFGQKIHLESITVQFRSAGHIPGSVAMLIEAEGKRILYTGDIKFIDTKLTHAADMRYRDIDILITECTYSYKDHPDRQIVSRGLRSHVREVIESGGIALLPCFAVGRTQEMLLNLSGLGVPIWLDGMGIEATRIILSYPKYLKDYVSLQRAFDRARKVKKAGQREQLIKKPCIIICTAGMLQAGPVHWYIKRLHKNERNSLIITGYQVEGTPGRTLLDTGRLIINGLDTIPKMDVRYLDFSDHTDRSHLLKFFNTVNPEKIVLVHGDRAEEFAKELRAKDFDAVAPKSNQKLKF